MLPAVQAWRACQFRGEVSGMSKQYIMHDLTSDLGRVVTVTAEAVDFTATGYLVRSITRKNGMRSEFPYDREYSYEDWHVESAWQNKKRIERERYVMERDRQDLDSKAVAQLTLR